MPKAGSAVIATTGAPVNANPFHALSVVAADANPADYAALRASLGEALGVVSSGNEALRLARRSHPAVWLLNSRLPDMSGFDLAQMLRRIEPHARIFLVSDEYQAEDELQSLTLGLSKHLCKPVEPAWIFQALAAAARRAAA